MAGDYTSGGPNSVGFLVPFTPGVTTWPTDQRGAHLTTRMVIVGTAGNINFTDMYGNTGIAPAIAGDHFWMLNNITSASTTAGGIVLGF